MVKAVSAYKQQLVGENAVHGATDATSGKRCE